MEDALRVFACGDGTSGYVVLILILMEDALRDISARAK